MSLLHTDAIVLHSQRLGEADKLVTFYSLQRGKVKAVAKGARRLRSRFGASLEPFTHCNVVLFEKRSGLLLRLNQASIIESFQRIRRGLPGISAAGRMARLVSLLMPGDEANRKVYDLLLKGFREAEKEDPDLEMILRFFDIHLLKHSGYLPKVDECVKCLATLGKGPVYFSVGGGGALCPSCYRKNPLSGELVSRGTLAFVFQANQMGWDKMDRLKAGKTIRGELQHILDTSFAHITGRSVSQTSPLYDLSR